MGYRKASPPPKVEPIPEKWRFKMPKINLDLSDVIILSVCAITLFVICFIPYLIIVRDNEIKQACETHCDNIQYEHWSHHRENDAIACLCVSSDDGIVRFSCRDNNDIWRCIPWN